MITLANEHLALTLSPEFGARVTSLTDLGTGRQWLVGGECVGGDAYLSDQARGWDECFPTVGVCDHPAWGGAIRDHGDLWGRPWRVDTDGKRCIATRDDPRYRFARSLHLAGSSVIADYHVASRSAEALPYLWSQHALLATGPGDHITLHGIAATKAGGRAFDWPHHPLRDLSVVAASDAGFALKVYGQTAADAAAEVAGPDGGIRFAWSGAQIPAFGLWLDYGGWPPGAPVHQVALEPTTAGADDLTAAESLGKARHLPPGGSHHWTVRITLTPPPARPL